MNSKIITNQIHKTKNELKKVETNPNTIEDFFLKFQLQRELKLLTIAKNDTGPQYKKLSKP